MKPAPLTQVLEALKKNKERVILCGCFFTFIVFVGGGFMLQHTRKQGRELAANRVVKTVELQVKAAGAERGSGGGESAPFFLEPSPSELLQQLSSLENLNEGVVEGRYLRLRVMWPAYFFSLEDGESGRGTLLLDVDEDGFGVVIESEVDLTAHPQLKTLEVGNKLWIGGEIQMIDRSGTGTVFLKPENFVFDGDPPFTRQKSVD